MTSQLSTVLSGAEETITEEDLGKVQEGERQVTGYVCMDKGQALRPYRYKFGVLSKNQVEVKVLYCGVCHSDIDMVENELNLSEYPLVPGHEIIGEIAQIGSNVTDLHVGQRVGIGWIQDSCGVCRRCRNGQENLCPKVKTTVNKYNGGFANFVRAQSKWVFPIPENLDSAKAAPLMCAGATVFAPLKEYDVKRGQKIGVIGLGGLGHLMIQMAKAKGCEVFVFSSSSKKETDALDLGADHFVCEDEISHGSQFLKNQMSFILCTATAELDWNLYLKLLEPYGAMCFVGFVPGSISFNSKLLISGNRRVVGNTVASISDTKEMLRFCSRHNIQAWIDEYDISEAQNVLQGFGEGITYRAVLKIGHRSYPPKRESL